jgi:multiple sugar transport system ATP-binding protein
VYVTHDQIEAMTLADRIVVMHDGIVEQIGTPLQLFDRPGNLFVAQFIGSPSMNVIDGKLQQEADEIWVDACGVRWPVPGAVEGARHGMPVHYGVRPGDLELCALGRGIDARVVVVEPTGAETELLLQVGDAMLTMVLYERTTVAPDDVVGLRVRVGKAHLFDQAGGRRLVPLGESEQVHVA